MPSADPCINDRQTIVKWVEIIFHLYNMIIYDRMPCLGFLTVQILNKKAIFHIVLQRIQVNQKENSKALH